MGLITITKASSGHSIAWWRHHSLEKPIKLAEGPNQQEVRREAKRTLARKKRNGRA